MMVWFKRGVDRLFDGSCTNVFEFLGLTLNLPEHQLRNDGLIAGLKGNQWLNKPLIRPANSRGGTWYVGGGGASL